MASEGSTKQTIFEEAVVLFADKGFANVSMREIAHAAGITVASIYNHYPSKDDILAECYSFFDETMRQLSPDLDELVALVPTTPPVEIMRRTTMVYPVEILPLMGNAMSVLVSQVLHDPRADAVMYEHMIELPRKYDVPLLNQMMELGYIEPIDVEAFFLVHSNYMFAAAVRFYTNHGIATAEYLDGLEQMFTMLRTTELAPK